MIINNLLIWTIKLIRPLLGPANVCLHQQSCSLYAIEQLNNQNIFIALWRITKRLLSCNPLYFYFK